MPIVGKFADGRLLVRETAAGPNPYDATARPTLTFNDLQQSVEAVLSVQIDSGHLAREFSVVGRVLTIAVHAVDNTPATDGEAFREIVVGDAEDLSGTNITALAVGT